MSEPIAAAHRPTPDLPAGVAVLYDGALWISEADLMAMMAAVVPFPEATCHTLFGYKVEL